MLTKKDKQEIDCWIQKFPYKKSAVLMALRIVQKRVGWLPQEALIAVSEHLDMPLIEVQEVVSFYTMYRTHKGGVHQLKVCSGLSCCLAGAKDVLASITERLGITVGETTESGNIELSETECLGACHKAPCAIVDDRYYQELLTPERLEKLLTKLESAT